MFPVVSILIPVYNSEVYLEQCLNSVVNQTYQHLQVVIVDDGSEDNSLEIALTFAKQYSFVEVYHQKNSGVATARNKLISLAKGDYILFVDSDDWIESDMIEKMLSSLDASQADIVVCGYIKDFGSYSSLCPVATNEFIILGAENIIKLLLLHKELNGSLWNKMVPRKFYEGLSFRKDIWYGEDCLFFWQALNQGVHKIYFLKDCFYHYRMNENSISHESFNYKKMTGHEVWRQINDEVHEKWPSLKNIALASFAVSDMWLLFYAAKSRYSYDNNIQIFQKNLRDHLRIIKKSGLINAKKLFFAYMIAYNYKLSSFFLSKVNI